MEITIPRLNDMHAHLRQGELQSLILPFHEAHTHHIVPMPNTDPPLIDPEEVAAYKSALEHKTDKLEFHVPLYLTETTQAHHILTASMRHKIRSCKLYPRGVTTGSYAGICLRRLDHLSDVFWKMIDRDMILSIHAEDADSGVLNAEQNALFLLDRLVDGWPNLKVIIEHVSTAFGVRWVKEKGPNVVATITPHHMLLTIDDILGNGIRPNHYCKPIAKTQEDRDAVVSAAISGNPKFFLGSDSAPHKPDKKYGAVGAAGIFNAPLLPELLAKVFDDNNALPKLPDFASNFGADFYGLPRCEETIMLSTEYNTDFACPIECLSAQGQWTLVDKVSCQPK